MSTMSPLGTKNIDFLPPKKFLWGKKRVELPLHDTSFYLLQSTNYFHTVNDQRKARLFQLLYTENVVIIRKCHYNRTNDNPKNTLK